MSVHVTIAMRHCTAVRSICGVEVRVTQEFPVCRFLLIKMHKKSLPPELLLLLAMHQTPLGCL